MEILLYFEEGPGAGNIKKVVEDIISSCASRLNFSVTSIDKIAVAHPESFQKALKDLTGSERYTNNKYLAVAKSHTRIVDGNPHHSIVFHSCVIEGIVQGISTGDNLLNWRPEHQLCYFTVGHELGHLKDNEIRTTSSTADTLKFPEGFDLDTIHNYYLEVLIDEFLASYCGDRIYTANLLQYEINEERVTLSASLLDFCRKLNAYTLEDNNLFGLACEGAGLIWAYLIQYAKIFAGKEGTQLEQEQIPSLFDSISGVETIHAEFEGILAILITGYPAIPDEFHAKAILIWEKVAKILGYKFVRINGEWHFYWR